jgi:hypothetical protein
MATGELGDQRLNERRDRLIAVLEQSPDAAFPNACANDAEVEALYRFLRNRRVSLDTVIEPHVAATQARCAAVGEVLVIHDTTDMVFAGEAPRAGLLTLAKRRHGFWVHAALAVSADGLRAPLGLLSLTSFVRKVRSPNTPKPATLTRWMDPTKESRCWGEGVAAVRARLGGPVHAIHVMDRAADSYELFGDMLTHADRFVVRLHHDRQVQTDAGLQSLTAAAPDEALGERQVTVPPRRAGNRPQQARKKHPPREGRVATLRFAARRLSVQRPQGWPRTLPPALAVNVVYVWEVEPPPGEEPVAWRLITQEPISTVEDVLRIVDIYRTRWLIEEFFKALKTGCAYEKRQLESLHTLLVALALLAPVAWQLLLLRHLAHKTPDVPATAVLTRRQVEVLRGSPAGTSLGERPTLAEALHAVAVLGGHLRQNGNPGWLVLGRGMQKLLVMETGWKAAEQARTM